MFRQGLKLSTQRTFSDRIYSKDTKPETVSSSKQLELNYKQTTFKWMLVLKVFLPRANFEFLNFFGDFYFSLLFFSWCHPTYLGKLLKKLFYGITAQTDNWQTWSHSMSPSSTFPLILILQRVNEKVNFQLVSIAQHQKIYMDYQNLWDLSYVITIFIDWVNAKKLHFPSIFKSILISAKNIMSKVM